MKVAHLLVLASPILLGARPIPGPKFCCALCTKLGYDSARTSVGRVEVTCPTLKDERHLVCEIVNKEAAKASVRASVTTTCDGETHTHPWGPWVDVPGKSTTRVEQDVSPPCKKLDAVVVNQVNALWDDGPELDD